MDCVSISIPGSAGGESASMNHLETPRQETARLALFGPAFEKTVNSVSAILLRNGWSGGVAVAGANNQVGIAHADFDSTFGAGA